MLDVGSCARYHACVWQQKPLWLSWEKDGSMFADKGRWKPAAMCPRILLSGPLLHRRMANILPEPSRALLARSTTYLISQGPGPPLANISMQEPIFAHCYTMCYTETRSEPHRSLLNNGR